MAIFYKSERICMSVKIISDISFEDVCEVLARGGVIVHPTETCYGFAADMFHEEGVRRLYDLKRMSLSKPSNVLVGSLRQAQEIGIFSSTALRLAEKFWPGPLTLVLPKTGLVPDFYTTGIETIGMRVPSHSWTLELLRTYGKPLVTTSANISGEKECYDIPAFLAQRGEGIDMPDWVLDGGVLEKNPPSTLVAVSGENIDILREGSLSDAVRDYVHQSND